MSFSSASRCSAGEEGEIQTRVVSAEQQTLFGQQGKDSTTTPQTIPSRVQSADADKARDREEHHNTDKSNSNTPQPGEVQSLTIQESKSSTVVPSLNLFIAPTPPLSTQKQWGSSGKLKSMAREVFERAYGLNGRVKEDHTVLAAEIIARCQCSNKSFDELIKGHSYESELADLRAQVPNYPPKKVKVRQSQSRQQANVNSHQTTPALRSFAVSPAIGNSVSPSTHRSMERASVSRSYEPIPINTGSMTPSQFHSHINRVHHSFTPVHTYSMPSSPRQRHRLNISSVSQHAALAAQSVADFTTHSPVTTSMLNPNAQEPLKKVEPTILSQPLSTSMLQGNGKNHSMSQVRKFPQSERLSGIAMVVAPSSRNPAVSPAAATTSMMSSAQIDSQTINYQNLGFRVSQTVSHTQPQQQTIQLQTMASPAIQAQTETQAPPFEHQHHTNSNMPDVQLQLQPQQLQMQSQSCLNSVPSGVSQLRRRRSRLKAAPDVALTNQLLNIKPNNTTTPIQTAGPASSLARFSTSLSNLDNFLSRVSVESEFMFELLKAENVEGLFVRAAVISLIASLIRSVLTLIVGATDNSTSINAVFVSMLLTSSSLISLLYLLQRQIQCLERAILECCVSLRHYVETWEFVAAEDLQHLFSALSHIEALVEYLLEGVFVPVMDLCLVDKCVLAMDVLHDTHKNIVFQRDNGLFLTLTTCLLSVRRSLLQAQHFNQQVTVRLTRNIALLTFQLNCCMFILCPHASKTSFLADSLLPAILLFASVIVTLFALACTSPFSGCFPVSTICLQQFQQHVAQLIDAINDDIQQAQHTQTKNADLNSSQTEQINANTQ